MLNRMPFMIVAACVLFVFVAPAGAQIVSNGSFESGLDDWVASGAVGASGSEGTTDGLLAALFNAADQLPNGVLSQTISTVPGESYTLEYDWGAYSAIGLQFQQISVEATGTAPLSSISTVATATVPATFVHESLVFIADSTTTTLTFTDISGNTISVDGILDDIIVTGPVATPVPSLGIWGIGSLVVLIGFAGFAGNYRPRRETGGASSPGGNPKLAL